MSEPAKPGDARATGHRRRRSQLTSFVSEYPCDRDNRPVPPVVHADRWSHLRCLTLVLLDAPACVPVAVLAALPPLLATLTL